MNQVYTEKNRKKFLCKIFKKKKPECDTNLKKHGFVVKVSL